MNAKARRELCVTRAALHSFKEIHQLKKLSSLSICLACIIATSSVITATPPHRHTAQQHTAQHNKQHTEAEHNFGSVAFERFHDQLHPLQHDALPSADYKTMRERAAALVRAGQPLTKMRVPADMPDRLAFLKHQKEFTAALTRFRRAATRGTNEQLKTSFTVVHDSFEEMAQLLPRK